MPNFICFAQIILCVLLTFILVGGYPRGAPVNSCGDPTPIHQTRLNATHIGIFYPQPMETSRYTIETNLRQYQNIPGSRVRVTLRANNGDYFRGFFVQATRDRFPLEAINRPAYGTFRPVDAQSQPRGCRAAVGRVGGITHTNNADKTSVSFDWFPPAGCNLGTVQFVATVVKQYNEYWVDVRSPNVTGAGFQGQRGILCRLYNDPYNTQIQRQVMNLLPTING